MSATKLQDLTGRRFERLAVLELSESRNGARNWRCICDCGNSCMATTTALMCARKRSCGCLHVESVRRTAQSRADKFVTHGATRIGHFKPEYRVWALMWDRCTNPNSPNWKRYGGRGITVCDKWVEFPQFFKDMGERPPGLSIERKNNNLGYCPENCIWADAETQKNNTSTSVKIEFRGEIKSIAQWGRALGIHPSIISRRRKRGLSVEEILSPVKHVNQHG